MTEPASKAPRVIRLAADDNVIVAVDQIGQGASIAGVTAQARIPRGHKMAAQAIEQGEPIRKFGQIIGFAKSPIAPGDWVHEHNVEMHDFARDYAFCSEAKPEDILPVAQQATFGDVNMDVAQQAAIFLQQYRTTDSKGSPLLPKRPRRRKGELE